MDKLGLLKLFGEMEIGKILDDPGASQGTSTVFEKGNKEWASQTWGHFGLGQKERMQLPKL